MVREVAGAVRPNESQNIRLKGLSGSLDSLIASAVYSINKQNHLFILHDKEEAAYFQNRS